MKWSLTIAAAVWMCVFNTALATEEKAKIPSLELLSSLVGVSASSQEFKDVLRNYHFHKNPKRDNSWGTGGVFLVALRNGRVQIGMRPPSAAANTPAVYSGELPKGLKAGDSIDNILTKLGTPLRTTYDPSAYYEMNFAGITVYTMGGKLFEVWLIPSKTDKAE